MAAAFQDLGSDFLLATHRVDRDEGAMEVQHFQQLWNGSDLVRFCVDGDLAQAQMMFARPGADEVQRSECGTERTAERLAIDGDMLDRQGFT